MAGARGSAYSDPCAQFVSQCSLVAPVFSAFWSNDPGASGFCSLCVAVLVAAKASGRLLRLRSTTFHRRTATTKLTRLDGAPFPRGSARGRDEVFSFLQVPLLSVVNIIEFPGVEQLSAVATIFAKSPILGSPTGVLFFFLGWVCLCDEACLCRFFVTAPPRDAVMAHPQGQCPECPARAQLWPPTATSPF